MRTKVKLELSREMSLFQVTMMGVGMMIGAGVFVSTGIGVGVAGPGWILLAFALNGLLAYYYSHPKREKTEWKSKLVLNRETGEEPEGEPEKKIEKILCPTKGRSPPGKLAWDLVKRVAAEHDAEVTIMHVTGTHRKGKL